ncbi:hypothetical protein OUZ56_009044 [Daphnia magna]|uniref:Uncharacterized protein n=1 Tax=Daphnia magna TaxID=35525 RepID=A0ABR0AET6_9CRUS|nr:hypothetical protein OUZ56_009044 [Daphnia magna]
MFLWVIQYVTRAAESFRLIFVGYPLVLKIEIGGQLQSADYLALMGGGDPISLMSVAIGFFPIIAALLVDQKTLKKLRDEQFSVDVDITYAVDIFTDDVRETHSETFPLIQSSSCPAVCAACAVDLTLRTLLCCLTVARYGGQFGVKCDPLVRRSGKANVIKVFGLWKGRPTIDISCRSLLKKSPG